MVKGRKLLSSHPKMYRVYYRRFENHKKAVAGYWENLTKDFKSEEEADIFIRRIKNNVIVSWCVKSKIYGSSSSL